MPRVSRAGALAAIALSLLALPVGARAFVTHDEFDAGNFGNATRIDNPYLPLTPGTQLVLTGTAFGEVHEVTFTVTDLTKVINGVDTVVVFDRDVNDGTLLEAELAFFAQDDDGTVWAMGEYPEEFDEDSEIFLGAPSTWIAGVDGAMPGIAMQAGPQVGDPPYIQGFAPTIEFEDQGKVVEENQSVCVAAGCFGDVIVVEETNLADPADGLQFKYHAPGTGVVQVTADVGSPDQETLTLASVRQLTPLELDEVRATVLEMDQRAYSVAGPVYGGTAPAVLPQPDSPGSYDDDPGDPDFDINSPFDPVADPDPAVPVGDPDQAGEGAGTGAGVLSLSPTPETTSTPTGQWVGYDGAGATPDTVPPTSVEGTSLLALEELPRTGAGSVLPAVGGLLLLTARLLSQRGGRRPA